MNITWQDPPASAVGGRRRSGWEEFADELRDSPGRWACTDHVHTNKEAARASASAIRNGRPAAFEPKGTFEAQSDDETRMVWVMYLGDEE